MRSRDSRAASSSDWVSLRALLRRSPWKRPRAPWFAQVPQLGGRRHRSPPPSGPRRTRDPRKRGRAALCPAESAEQGARRGQSDSDEAPLATQMQALAAGTAALCCLSKGSHSRLAGGCSATIATPRGACRRGRRRRSRRCRLLQARMAHGRPLGIFWLSIQANGS